MIRIKILFLIVLILAGIGANGQDLNLGVEVHGARGFLLPHRQNMAHLPEGPAHFGEVRIFTQTNQDQFWKRLYGQPQIGVTIRGFELANQKLLGYGLGIAAYFSAPVINQNRFRWHLEVGAGPGLISKPFNLKDNYKNIAIGSYGNAFIMLGQRFTYAATDRLDLALATSFNHFSNAAFALPNLGLNYPAVSLGISYRPVRLKRDSNAIEITILRRVPSQWIFTGNWGIKQSPRPYNAKFPALTMVGERDIGLSKKSSFTMGFDVFYNVSLYQYRIALGESITPAENLQAGFHLGYGLHIDDAMILIQMGAYALDTYKRDGFLFNRVGFRYFFTEHLGFNLGLKTHFFKADYFELGLAYRM